MIIVILSEFDWETDLFTSGAHIWLRNYFFIKSKHITRTIFNFSILSNSIILEFAL